MSAIASVEDVLDTGRLTRWMRHPALGEGPIEDVMLLTGGTQNVLVRFGFGSPAETSSCAGRHCARDQTETL